MSQQKLYRILGDLYRPQPVYDFGCNGCDLEGEKCGGNHSFDCTQPPVIAKRIPAGLPIPPTVTIIES